MASFVPGQPIATDVPTIQVDGTLKPGTYVFELQVTGASGAASGPVRATVQVVPPIPVGPPIVVTGPPLIADPLGPVSAPGTVSTVPVAINPVAITPVVPANAPLIVAVPAVVTPKIAPTK